MSEKVSKGENAERATAVSVGASVMRKKQNPPDRH
jgi:hypothetical protein